MKKFGLGVLIAGFVLLLSSCYFVVPLSAKATIVNNSNESLYCLAGYNKIKTTESDIFLILPGETKNLTLKGTLTKAMFSDSTEHFDLWYRGQEEWEQEKNKSHVVDDVAFNFTWENKNYVSANDKRSQNYKVVFSNDPSDGNLLIELTWK